MRAVALVQTYEHDPSDEIELYKIAIQMKMNGLSDTFITSAIRTALDYEGVADLVKMWAKEIDPQERDEVIADIQEMIDACAQQDKVECPSIRLNDLTAIAQHIREFKDALLENVIQQGGISHVAKLTGIPQPSLSRFLNSNAMPQRSTLLKIGKALKIDAIQLAAGLMR